MKILCPFLFFSRQSPPVPTVLFATQPLPKTQTSRSTVASRFGQLVVSKILSYRVSLQKLQNYQFKLHLCIKLEVLLKKKYTGESAESQVFWVRQVFWSKRRAWEQESRKKVFSLLLTQCVTASKKGFLRFCWSIARDWVGILRRKKTLSVLPHTVHNVRCYSLFRSVVKMNMYWLAVSKLIKNEIAAGWQDHLTGANQKKVSKI